LLDDCKVLPLGGAILCATDSSDTPSSTVLGNSRFELDSPSSSFLLSILDPTLKLLLLAGL
jgi:hypothetical protein